MGTLIYSIHKLSFFYRFHSISFPSEWGQFIVFKGYFIKVIVSIQLVSPASGDVKVFSFHNSLISSFPFNWFPQRVGTVDPITGKTKYEVTVSIQLVSPASGDLMVMTFILTTEHVSIQLVSPASGDYRANMRTLMNQKVSIQLVSPASGDFKMTLNFTCLILI